MMYIVQGSNAQQWHTGEPIPKITDRVVVFQVDGDELQLILNAMKSNPTEPKSE